MDEEANIQQRVLSVASQRILFLPHAVRQMLRPERMILREEVVEVINNGTVIENYPEDQRGHSCLLSCLVRKGRTIHVVCSPKEDYLAVITAYLPDREEWSDDFTRRLKK